MHRLFLLLLLLLCLATAHGQQLPPWRVYNAWIRDLPYIHNDFEGPYSADLPQRGLIAASLNPDARPYLLLPALRNNTLQSGYYDWASAFRPPPTVNLTSETAISNQGHFYFAEYFMDIPGVNIAYNISLNFTLLDPVNATYQWVRPQFFPLDGMGFGLKEGYKVQDGSSPIDQLVPHNFAFTTEMSMTFFYRGGETFSFSGDDDLWIFVDGKLSSCDVGGIHSQASCSLRLDDFGFQLNTTHQMSIFHAERHTDSSTFVVTTSIKPINHAPVAQKIALKGTMNQQIRLDLLGFDIDNDVLTYIVAQPPAHGNLLKGLGPTSYIYLPTSGWNGTDTFQYVVNDGELNSTLATVSIQVDPKTGGSVIKPVHKEFALVAGETAWIPLEASSTTTQQGPYGWFLLENPKYGYASILPNNTLKYQSVNNGTDVIRIQVLDTSDNFATAIMTAQVSLPFIPVQLSKEQIVGIVLGTIFGVSLLVAAIAYFIYHRYMASKFVANWQKEWAQGTIQSNPLFESNVKEGFNPMYS